MITARLPIHARPARGWSAGWGTVRTILILVCPHCRARFDVRRAGVALDSDHHLEPLPILRRSGVLSVAVPAGR